jgi:hypothetical protein
MKLIDINHDTRGTLDDDKVKLTLVRTKVRLLGVRTSVRTGPSGCTSMSTDPNTTLTR